MKSSAKVHYLSIPQKGFDTEKVMRISDVIRESIEIKGVVLSAQVMPKKWL